MNIYITVYIKNPIKALTNQKRKRSAYIPVHIENPTKNSKKIKEVHIS